ncbi:hydrolase, partial [Stenotrophomonas maltophilia]
PEVFLRMLEALGRWRLRARCSSHDLFANVRGAR